jgi:hypothetical protein
MLTRRCNADDERCGWANPDFRARRDAADFPGFQGKAFAPGCGPG